MAENKLIVTFDVTTGYDLTIEEATHQLLQAEELLNSRTRLRWHLTQVTLSDIKTFIENQQNKIV